jgi:hypothetical protein
LRSAALAGLATLFPLVARAQQLTSHELSVGPAAAMARHTIVAQVTIQLLVNSAARSGVGIYAGVGTAFMARRGSPGQGYVAVLLGLEGAPGRRHGWFVEGGLGGGTRAAGGWRMRWFPKWWRS